MPLHYSRRLAALILGCAALAAGLQNAKAAGPQAISSTMHPLIGSWTWTAFNTKCAETFLYRANNTMLMSSGEAVSEWNYTVSPQAGEKGFYKVTETSMRHNGKKDCSGDTVGSSGIVHIRYLQFNPARDKLLACREESLSACFGPLNRGK